MYQLQTRLSVNRTLLISTSDRVSQLLQHPRIRRTVLNFRESLEQLRGKIEQKLLDDHEDDITRLPLIVNPQDGFR